MKTNLFILLVISFITVNAQNDTLRSFRNYSPEMNALIKEGFLLLNGENGVQKDPAKALQKFETGATMNNDICQFFLGRMYENGIGTKSNPAQAEKWYRKSAENGNALAQFQLGSFYKKGSGGEVRLKTQSVILKWLPEKVFLMPFMQLGICISKVSGFSRIIAKPLNILRLQSIKKVSLVPFLLAIVTKTVMESK